MVVEGSHRYVLPTSCLSPREEQVLGLAALGYKERAVGEHLGITEQAVKNCLTSIRIKINARNTTHAVYIRYAYDSITTA